MAEQGSEAIGSSPIICFSGALADADFCVGRRAWLGIIAAHNVRFVTRSSRCGKRVTVAQCNPHQPDRMVEMRSRCTGSRSVIAPSFAHSRIGGNQHGSKRKIDCTDAAGLGEIDVHVDERCSRWTELANGNWRRSRGALDHITGRTRFLGHGIRDAIADCNRWPRGLVGC